MSHPCIRPLKPVLTPVLVFVFTVMTGYSLAASGEQDGAAGASNVRKNRVYAKIILPMKVPAQGEHPLVESWIAKQLEKRGETDFRAVTEWVHLPEEGEGVVHVWNAEIDGKSWGCPVVGRNVERIDGKVKVDLTGWAPFPLKQSGMVLPAEIGSRKIAVVGRGRAYVALFVGPTPLDDR